MTRDFETIVYSHRQHPLHARCAEAWFRHVPHTSRFTIIREAGTAAQNSNRALEMCRSRYLFLLDEDAILFQEGWLEAMLDMPRQYSDFGVGSCLSVPNAETAAKTPQQAGSGDVEKVHALPGYVFLLDMQRLAGIRYPEDAPGDKGITDVDVCLQARHHRGLSVYRNNSAFVIHQEKPSGPIERARAGYTSSRETEDEVWWPQQCRWMDARWGLGKWSI